MRVRTNLSPAAASTRHLKTMSKEQDVPILTIDDAKAALDGGQVTAEGLVLQACDAMSEHRG